MLAVLACLAVVAAILLLSEQLLKSKKLKGENQRKFVHIVGGTFAASWPWLISWRSIQLIGLALLVGTLINHQYKYFTYHNKTKRESYGDIFAALAIIFSATLVTNKIFFALAILELALADGFAAIVGQRFGKNWQYQVLNQTKTIIGSMAFWGISFFILYAGVMLGAHDVINLQELTILVLILPPILTAVENVSVLGLDNLSVPLVTLLALHIAQTA